MANSVFRHIIDDHETVADSRYCSVWALHSVLGAIGIIFSTDAFAHILSTPDVISPVAVPVPVAPAPTAPIISPVAVPVPVPAPTAPMKNMPVSAREKQLKNQVKQVIVIIFSNVFDDAHGRPSSISNGPLVLSDACCCICLLVGHARLTHFLIIKVEVKSENPSFRIRVIVRCRFRFADLDLK